MAEFDPEQRRRALQAFMEREGIRVARWEKSAELGDGTLRKFMENKSQTLTDRTYSKLAKGAGAIVGREVTPQELQSKDAQPHSTTPQSAISGSVSLRRDGAPLPPLILWRSSPGAGLERGAFVLSNEKAGEAERPDFLEFAENAFATRVVTRENEPAYRPRDTLLVNPDEPTLDGDDCVFTADPARAGGAPAVVGQLIRSTPTLWIIRQYALKSEQELSRKEWPNAWLIVGRYNRR